MKAIFLFAVVAAATAQTASAQDGAYFGLGLGASQFSSEATVVPGYEASGTDFALALTAGYRFAASGALAFGVEGNLDLFAGERMSDDIDACTGASPSWCEIDTVLRLRGTLTSDLAGGNRITTSLGGVMVDGLAEDGPGNNVDTRGHGFSLGVAWEQVGGAMPLRVDLNYDTINSDDANTYERDLDMIGLRLSYMF
jgi:hypothetical protein